jgi:hypothetical protein
MGSGLNTFALLATNRACVAVTADTNTWLNSIGGLVCVDGGLICADIAEVSVCVANTAKMASNTRLGDWHIIS